MNVKDKLRLWNKNKWEFKNRAMYQNYAANKWPWFNADLDPDIGDYVAAMGPEKLDILDLGTCSGTQAIELARRGHRVVGTEVSETALGTAIEAVRELPDLPIEFLMDDITASSLEENRFELVLDRGCYHSICCFHHDEYVEALKRVMKPGGVLLLKTMSNDETRFVSWDEVGGKSVQMPYHFGREELQGLLSPHFDIEQIVDSFFYSSVTDPPAKALFTVARNKA